MSYVVEDELNGDATETYRKFKYFPMVMAQQDDSPLQMVLGVRGDGKTMNSKKWILMDWFYGGIKSYWVVQTKEEMREMIPSKDFHIDLQLDEIGKDTTQETWDEVLNKYSEEDIICHFLSTDVSMDGEFLYDKSNNDDDWFMRIIPLSMYHKYKKGKHPKVHRMYYDEFMKEKYITMESFKIHDLLTSVQREKEDFKFILLGNAISMNHPLFVAYELWEIDENDVITPFDDDDGVKLGKLWNWKRPLDDAEKKNGKLLWYRMAKKSGYAKYAVENSFKNDNINNILGKIEDSVLKKHGEKLHTLKAGELYFDLWHIPAKFNNTGKKMYYCKVNTKDFAVDEVRYALDPDNVQDGIEVRPDISSVFGKRLMKGLIYYDSQAVKQNIWKTIKKFFH